MINRYTEHGLTIDIFLRKTIYSVYGRMNKSFRDFKWKEEVAKTTK